MVVVTCFRKYLWQLLFVLSMFIAYEIHGRSVYCIIIFIHAAQKESTSLSTELIIADSAELKTVRKCTPYLEIALKGLESALVNFLNQEGFITDDVAEKIKNPVIVLTDIQKSTELTGWIKHRVELDPDSYHVLLDWIKAGGSHYKPIVKILEAEFLKHIGDSEQCCSGGLNCHT
jgi:hypothetical protein